MRRDSSRRRGDRRIAARRGSGSRGYNFKWGHRVIPDPADAAKIYITTFGGSVWHGPADQTMPSGAPAWQVRTHAPPVARQE